MTDELTIESLAKELLICGNQAANENGGGNNATWDKIPEYSRKFLRSLARLLFERIMR